MSSKTKLIDLSLADFAGELAARTPTPGGGSLAAYLAACGAALASMAFRFTSGEKYAAAEASMAQRVTELDELRRQALELVQRDSEAYDEVTAAYALPKATEPDRAARSAEIQAALKGALEAPFTTMQVALEALRLAAAGAPDINRNLASDCGVGGACLAEAIEGAFGNVRINAGSIKDEEYVRARLAQCETMRNEARELAASLKRAIEQELA